MPNPFYVDPTQGYDPNALSGLGQALRVNRLEREQVEATKEAEQKQVDMQAELQAAMQSGDTNQVAEVSAKYPEIADSLWQGFGAIKDEQKGSMSLFNRQLMSAEAGDVAGMYERRIAEVEATPGGDASQSKEGLADWLQHQDIDKERKDAGIMFSLSDPDGYKQFVSEQPEPEEVKLGSGAMSGYTFTEAKGYEIDPTIKAALDKDAANKAQKKGMLTSKDVAGVNDKVTALTKDAVAINDSAKSLAALNETSTPTDQLAAIFKFMKSLDPTSVVREGEQNMAKRTGGPADAFVGFVNQIQGEGGLTPSAFKNMVNTSISLANSAADSSNGQLRGYLDVLSDKINPRDLEKMQARAPQRIENVGEEISTDDLALKWANENPNDPRAQRILQAQGK